MSWWQRLGRGQRTAVAIVGAIVAVNIVASLGSGLLGSDPGGPVSSSFSTGSDGLRGWSELLERRGHDVVRQRSSIVDDPVRRGDTVVLADPQTLGESEARALLQFLRGGGRLVLAGPDTTPLLAVLGLGANDIDVDDGPARSVPWVPVAEMAGVRELVGDGTIWTDVGGMLPVAGTAGGQPVVAVAAVGRGRVVALADAAVLQNARLDDADNAAFAVQVVGSRSHRVVFLEAPHGFARTGWKAVPSDWKWGLLLALVAVCLWWWSVGTRAGGPEPQERALRPARRDHVDAVASDLEVVVVTDQEAVDPLVAATRRAVAAEIGAPADATPAVLYATGESVGADLGELAVLTHPVSDPHHALEVGALAAARQRARHGLAPTDTVAPEPSAGGTDP